MTNVMSASVRTRSNILLLAAAGVVIGGLVGTPSPVQAHASGTSHLNLTIAPNHIAGRLDISVADLDHAIGLDRDKNAKITWGEIEAVEDDITLFAIAHIGLSGPNGPCGLTSAPLLLDHKDGETYIAAPFRADCGQNSGSLTIQSTLLFDDDPLHRTIVEIVSGDDARTSVLTSEHRMVMIPALVPKPTSPLSSGLGESWAWWFSLAVLAIAAMSAPWKIRADASKQC